MVVNKNQFRSVRLTLGYSTKTMGDALGLRNGTIQRLENGIPPLSGIPFSKQTALDHIMSFACAWMLFNGGPMIPWPEEEDRKHFLAFKAFHKMNNQEMAALFNVSIREMEYMLSPTAVRRSSKMRLMALCWMRIFGSRDPFAFPLHQGFTAESAVVHPIRVEAPMTIDLRPNLDQTNEAQDHDDDQDG